MTSGYRLLDHTADFGLEITAENPAALFSQAARALFDLICGPLSADGGRRHRVEIAGTDWSDLLVNWLRELLYFWGGQQQLICNVAIDAIGPTRLQATVTTVDYDPRRHEISNEIKAVTYHQADVVCAPGGWLARVVLDV